MTTKVAGVKPATVVHNGAITVEELAAQIQQTREMHGEMLQKYHEVWYNASFTWPYTHFLGVGLMKCPNDLWMYQQIMSRLRPVNIIETGTYHGGSALWFAFLQDMLGIKNGCVLTVDYEAYDLDPVVRHPRITYLHGNSVDAALVTAIKGEMQDGPTLVCLDSDHSAEHVRRELKLYAPLCKVGDWLVVEDTNIGWGDGTKHLIEVGERWARCSCGAKWPATTETSLNQFKCPQDKSDRGARGGLQDYMDAHPNEWRQDVLSERYLLTMNPGGWLQRMAECTHG